MADWILKDPRMTSKDGMSFSISFPGEGRYECSVTGLRFETTAETTITYRYCSWDQYFPDITRRGWSPASSLFDIKVTGAELAAIQIPHFLCIDGKPCKNEFRFFHMEEEGDNCTVLDPSLVFSKYAVLLKPTFTLIGFVQSIRRMFPVHGIVIIFRAHVAKLTLHVYLIPNSRDIEKVVQSHEKNHHSVEINKPPQTRPLRFGQKYSLKTKSSSVIIPEILEFYYLSSSQRQSYCEVCTNDINIAVDLKFLECSPHRDICIWECVLKPEDMQIQPLKEDESESVEEKHFMDKYKSEIIQRLTNPEPILDHLLSKLYITDEEYDRIRSRDEYQEKNRELYKVSRSWSSKGKDVFYMILRKKNPHFVRSLEEK
ncbi:NACHT, LRR and PYD domains-containing protein 1b allele 2-like [Protopterus annectens]|uniref:NACHT, LRR and PYD domains-containing protein 1b allele 2-like n=1 Tax=Protopterus annectens TaxID=7888 RepID=UPI001CF987A4|nr:NACHT, LRR and PYD domains-containing protein 1b allele 2-like [Protopterus annectens]